MSEKQLTVAELMARASAEGRAGAPKRRRRRSLEDGGISVAELTGSLPKVDAKPEEPKHSSEPIDEETPATPAAPAKDADKPAEKPEVKSAKPEPKAQPDAKVEAKPKSADKPAAKPEVKAEPKPAVPVVSVVGKDDPIKLTTDSFPAQQVETPVEKKPQPQTLVKPEEQTAQIPVVADAPKTDEDIAEWAVDKPADDLTDDISEDDADERVSIVSILLMVVIGLCVGAAIFLGFKELWANVNTILTGALAGVMTLGLVGIVHALRTERDGLSMTLAAVAGLAVTFGPLLIVGL